MQQRRLFDWHCCLALVVGLAAAGQLRAQTAVESDGQATTTADCINARFLDPDLDPQELIDIFERESREVFTARQAILAAIGVEAGDRVADVGAGTGLFTVLFSHEVGDRGWVFAVDIAPPLVEYIAERCEDAGRENVTPVLCDRDSVNLPPDSVDLVFVCDTYHHFEFPPETLRSIHRALRADGRLVIVDFIREEGVSSEWVLGHVRAGKDVFTQEIVDAGFVLDQEPAVKGLSENYLLIFRKRFPRTASP